MKKISTSQLLKHCLWIASPVLICLVLVIVAWFTDFANAKLVVKIRLENLLLFIGCVISSLVFFYIIISRKINTLLTKSQLRHKKQYQEEHQKFIQRLDHELKNPLTAIQLSLENMQLNPKNNQSVADLKTQTVRLTKITADLRKLAAFNEQELELQEVNIAELLQETKDLVSELVPERSIQLLLPKAPWPVPTILADNDLLQLAFYNIVENAVKYSEPNDDIEIRAYDSQGMVHIEFADTGIGIAAEDIGNVWDELFRGTNAIERNGTGIGLSLVKRIIEHHHGVIDIESKESMGTRILLSLPILNKV